VTRRRLLLALGYWLSLVALLAPVWLFAYFPSTDGPSHLFNAYVFANYSRVPLFQQIFLLHVPSAGNLTGHALAIFLLKIGVPGEICEKLIATLAIAALALAFRYAVTAFSSVSALAPFLVFPFLYNWPMQMGFWSFSLGVPFLFISVGLYFRYRGRWRPSSFLYLLLAAACAYLSHPIAWAVSALVIALLALGIEGPQLRFPYSRKRALVEILVPLAAFLPFALPNFLFAAKSSYLEWQHVSSLAKWLWPLYTDSPVHLFPADAHAARLLFLVIVLGSCAHFLSKLRRRNLAIADVLLPAALVLLGLGLISPVRIGEGTFIQVRLLLFGFLLCLVWLGATLPPRALAPAAALALLFTAWLILVRLPAWRTTNREIAAFVQLARIIPANALICQIDFIPQSETVLPLKHVADLLPAENFVDVRDYEAGRSMFWTRFRPGYFFDENFRYLSGDRNFEGALDRFEQRTGKHVDYIVLTEFQHAPPAALRAELPERYNEYQLVSGQLPWLAIYKRSSAPLRLQTAGNAHPSSRS